MGHQTSHRMVAELLHDLGYSLQANRKTWKESAIRTATPSSSTSTVRRRAFQQRGEPVISVDTKKKELVGDFKNGGREWYAPQGMPEKVRVHDFLIPELGRAIPYGVYDLATNKGWVSVGIDHDTSSFARGDDSPLVELDGTESDILQRTDAC